jgi:uncharacterized membrane protein YphA (DoxX/SURF4 family)
MLVAFGVSLKLGEEPLRTLLYFFIFSTIAITGPGEFSVENFLKHKPMSRTRLDFGLLSLRFGVAMSIALLNILKQAADDFLFVRAGSVWPIALLCVTTLSILCGYKTRIIAVILGACWLWTSCAELFSKQDWFSLPVRSILFVLAFTAIGLLGPGAFSLDQGMNRSRDS